MTTLPERELLIANLLTQTAERTTLEATPNGAVVIFKYQFPEDRQPRTYKLVVTQDDV